MHHFLMPRDQAVSNLMCLIPSMLECGRSLIEQNTFSIWQIQRRQRKFSNGINYQRGSLKYLDRRNANTAYSLPKYSWVASGIETQIQLQKFTYIFETQWWFWISQSLQYALDARVNISLRFLRTEISCSPCVLTPITQYRNKCLKCSALCFTQCMHRFGSRSEADASIKQTGVFGCGQAR